MRIDAERGYSSLPEVAFDQGRKRTLRDAATFGRRCAKQVVSYVSGNRLPYHCFLGILLREWHRWILLTLRAAPLALLSLNPNPPIVSSLGDIGGAVHPVGNGSPVLLWYRLDQVPQAGALADGDREADIHFPAGGNDSVGVEATVGPHRELPAGPAVAAPAPPFHAGSGRRHGRCWPGPRAAGTSAPRRCRRQWPAAGDSRGRRYSRGGALPPWPVHRSRRWSSPGRWSGASRRVRPQRPRPGPTTGGSPGRVDGHAPSEAAQEGPQGGWRLDHAA